MPSIRARATVLSLETSRGKAYADLVVESAPSCQRCASGRGCGAGAFTSRDAECRVTVEVPGDLVLSAGDVVGVEANSRSILEASVAAYGLPLAGTLAGALLGAILHLAEGLVIALALVGLVAGFRVGRRYLGSVCWQDELRLTAPGADEARL